MHNSNLTFVKRFIHAFIFFLTNLVNVLFFYQLFVHCNVIILRGHRSSGGILDFILFRSSFEGKQELDNGERFKEIK